MSNNKIIDIYVQSVISSARADTCLILSHAESAMSAYTIMQIQSGLEQRCWVVISPRGITLPGTYVMEKEANRMAMLYNRITARQEPPSMPFPRSIPESKS